MLFNIGVPLPQSLYDVACEEFGGVDNVSPPSIPQTATTEEVVLTAQGHAAFVMRLSQAVHKDYAYINVYDFGYAFELARILGALGFTVVCRASSDSFRALRS